MFAVIRTGGKQYRVAQGDILDVEKLDAEEGSEIALDDVLMVGEGSDVAVGAPRVTGASVTAKIVSQFRGPKVLIVKFRRRKHYRKTQGHRQNLTRIEITQVSKA